ncbi:hypothetical protein SSX86_029219 [Deinandra increscens subsp. villosa]|uniref:RNA helicase n=1 Tax=Deinandra increscens subsp. villosa TaxID=3103831 RepID=A0AAP0GM46_9ASTR
MDSTGSMPTDSSANKRKRHPSPTKGTWTRKKLKKRVHGPVISNATRILLRQTLEDFQKSNDDEYTFGAHLKGFERAEVQMLWNKMGMKATVSNSEEGKVVSVYKVDNTHIKKNTTAESPITSENKPKKLKKTKANSSITSFTFSEDGKTVLRDFFSDYPPGDDGEAEKTAVISSKNTRNMQMKTSDIFCKPLLKKQRLSKKLKSVVARMQSDPKLKQITENRSKLPIASFKDIITSTVESNQVVLISGETGCGKTTQVPQYLLDYMWSKGESCKIVCTQPRRISAVSVAERISVERGEPIGETVGYKIRLETKGGMHSSIVFCTTGLLLRILVKAANSIAGKEKSAETVKDAFPDITHIIVDEIHERDRYSDFMLTIIRDMLPLYPHLRVVLMSATLDAERFSQYFGGCPIIRVPGFTYDVKKLYLEDVLLLLKSKATNAYHLDGTSKATINENVEFTEDHKLALDEAISIAWSSDELDSLIDFVSGGEGASICNYQHSVTGVTPLMVFARKGRVGDICLLLSLGANCHLQDNEGNTSLSWAEHANQKEASDILRQHLNATTPDSKEKKLLLDRYLQYANPELVDVVLIEELLIKICTESEEGAILVFLPGWDDITKLQNKLGSSKLFKDKSKFLISALHSMVPFIEQKKVFERPSHGCRKIILSTNIAETSVTIDDVVFVIDSGRVKEKNYDPYNEISTLQSSWISKANAKQREGRAGRCQAGICYHLYSKLRAASLMNFQVPEIKRTPIEELCLQVKLLDPSCKIEDFLKRTLDPPVSLAIHNAITVLQNLGALSPNEELTELGEKLGLIPVHPVTSKMLLFAISVKCLDPALTLACANGYRDPFTLQTSPDNKKKANAAKSELASSLCGGHGDHLATIAAFECWKKAKEEGKERKFFSKYFVSYGVMNMLRGMRKQLEQELHINGFIPKDKSRLNRNSHDLSIIHAVLVAGLYPRVGLLLSPKEKAKRFVIQNANNQKIRLNNLSVNSRLKLQKKDGSPLVIYDEITRSDTGLSIKSCSIIGPLPLLLLATEIAVAPSDEEVNNEGHGDELMSNPDNAVTVIADRWLSFKSTALDAAQICCLRERLSAAIMFKIAHPGKELPEVLAACIDAVAKVLSYDGLCGVNASFESVESANLLTPVVTQTNVGQEKKQPPKC